LQEAGKRRAKKEKKITIGRNGPREIYENAPITLKISEEKVEAKYEKGILKLTLPRDEAEKPKKIEIKAS